MCPYTEKVFFCELICSFYSQVLYIYLYKYLCYCYVLLLSYTIYAFEKAFVKKQNI